MLKKMMIYKETSFLDFRLRKETEENRTNLN